YCGTRTRSNHDPAENSTRKRSCSSAGYTGPTILAMALLAAPFPAFGTHVRLANMSSFGYLLFYALTTLGFPVARERLRRPTVCRSVPTWIAATFSGSTTLILLFVISCGSAEILIALTVLALGVPCYLALRWKITLGQNTVGARS